LACALHQHDEKIEGAAADPLRDRVSFEQPSRRIELERPECDSRFEQIRLDLSSLRLP
jgi:hypothetical protein